MYYKIIISFNFLFLKKLNEKHNEKHKTYYYYYYYYLIDLIAVC